MFIDISFKDIFDLFHRLNDCHDIDKAIFMSHGII